MGCVYLLQLARLYDDKTLVGKVLKVGVHPQTAVQSDEWKPPEFVVVAIYARVPGTAYFVKWSLVRPVAIHAKHVHQSALVAVGFSMQSVDGLPSSWPFELRRPSGRRRFGPAYVMDASVQAQLSSRAAHRDHPRTGVIFNENR